MNNSSQHPSSSHPAMGASYAVDLPVFQGPLDLLLHLIEKQELDINEVSLVAVTDQYIATINRLDDLDPGSISDFLVIASRMLYIKSRNLLPAPQPTSDDEEDDPAQALIRQLIEYRQFKEVAQSLQQRTEDGLRLYTRVAVNTANAKQRNQQTGADSSHKLGLEPVALSTLQKALQRALQRIPKDPPMPKVKTYTITVAEQIENIRQQIQFEINQQISQQGLQSKTLPFDALLSKNYTRLEVIVTFLAVLELIKLREVSVAQEDMFEEIVLTPIVQSE
ncbi:MAG: segregation/condensation protein A [Chloroflexota bacterium]